MEILSKLVPYPERKVLQILTTSCLKISGPHRAASKSILHSFCLFKLLLKHLYSTFFLQIDFKSASGFGCCVAFGQNLFQRKALVKNSSVPLKKAFIGYVRVKITGKLRLVYIFKFRLKSCHILLSFETKGKIPVAITKSMLKAQCNSKNQKMIRNIIK